jgi:hypothetical protein
MMALQVGRGEEEIKEKASNSSDRERKCVVSAVQEQVSNLT